MESFRFCLFFCGHGWATRQQFIIIKILKMSGGEKQQQKQTKKLKYKIIPD